MPIDSREAAWRQHPDTLQPLQQSDFTLAQARKP
jgi:hypothetical protein